MLQRPKVPEFGQEAEHGAGLHSCLNVGQTKGTEEDPEVDVHCSTTRSVALSGFPTDRTPGEARMPSEGWPLLYAKAILGSDVDESRCTARRDAMGSGSLEPSAQEPLGGSDL